MHPGATVHLLPTAEHYRAPAPLCLLEVDPNESGLRLVVTDVTVRDDGEAVSLPRRIEHALHRLNSQHEWTYHTG